MDIRSEVTKMPTIDVSLSKKQKRNLIKAKETGKPIRIRIDKAHMDGEIPLTVDEETERRYKINKKNKRGMMITLSDVASGGNALLDAIAISNKPQLVDDSNFHLKEPIKDNKKKEMVVNESDSNQNQNPNQEDAQNAEEHVEDAQNVEGVTEDLENLIL